MAAHNYWRVVATEADAATYPTIGEIELRMVSGGANACVDGTAIASSEYNADHVATKALDLNTVTRWSSAIGDRVGAWWGYHFVDAVNIVQASIQAATTYEEGVPTGLDFEWSDDGIGWYLEKSYSSIPAWSASEIKLFSVVTAYTLTAESGSFAFSGNAASLLKTSKLNAASGSFAYAGHPASLLKSSRLPAESGAFAFTGHDAQLIYSGAAHVNRDTWRTELAINRRTLKNLAITTTKPFTLEL